MKIINLSDGSYVNVLVRLQGQFAEVNHFRFFFVNMPIPNKKVR